jgi:hypothetical protein
MRAMQMASTAPGAVSYFRDTRTPQRLGDDADASTPVLEQPVVKTALALAYTYHGYKRTGSIAWALAYLLAGKVAPVVTGAVVLAQGYGAKKGS